MKFRFLSCDNLRFLRQLPNIKMHILGKILNLLLWESNSITSSSFGILLPKLNNILRAPNSFLISFKYFWNSAFIFSEISFSTMLMFDTGLSGTITIRSIFIFEFKTRQYSNDSNQVRNAHINQVRSIYSNSIRLLVL